MRPVCVALMVTLAAAGCGSSTSATAPSSTPAPAITTYLSELIDIMQAHSVNRNRINWTDFRRQVIGRAQDDGARSVPDAYPAIELALALLADHHSFYTGANGRSVSSQPLGKSCRAVNFGEPVLPDDIGYVQMPGFYGSPRESVQYADYLQDQMRKRDRPNLAGWIVDLRGNIGGNLYPMLAGIGPLLGEGIAGYFVEPDGTSFSFGYANGVGFQQDGPQCCAASNPYRLIREPRKIAIITGPATVSSGEAIAVAFRGRPNTRSFGTPTCGLSTANEGYKLSDGATLVLTGAVQADRNHTQYGGEIIPDVIVNIAPGVMPVVIDWLHE
jgi:carboxyl-terminal processing protease